ncbi:MAG: elongation factor 4, partial [Myxococcales bacterium]
YLAIDNNLELVPVLNKIDLPSAEPARVRAEIEDVVGLDASDAVEISAKTGVGVDRVLEAIVAKIPPAVSDRSAPLRGLVFDSWFDNYLGAMVLIRVMEGVVRKGDRIHMMQSDRSYEVTRVGVFSPGPVEVADLGAGQVGFLAAGIKDVVEARVGDTITHEDRPCVSPLPGFKKVKPMVFAGLYPIDSSDYEELRDAIEKLRLNDSAFSYEPETSAALGFGFRCGFLGLLHIEIVQERLEREFNLDLITTAPTVEYRVLLTDGSTIQIDSPAKLPDAIRVESISEPFISATIHTPNEYLGGIFSLCEEKRGTQKNLTFPSEGRAIAHYEMPLAEIVYDFYDRLKSTSRGYASLDYEPIDFRVSPLSRLDMLINGDRLDAPSIICHRDRAHQRGRELALKLKELIPRQMFEIVIQGAVVSRIVARETVKAMRKNVTAKCYGGDISRKRKLLEKQKEGKKRMKQVGNVEIPQEAFLAVLKVGE